MWGTSPVDFSRLHGTEFIGIRAYPRLKRRVIVKRPAEHIGSRNDMRSGLSEFLFRCKERDDGAKNRRVRKCSTTNASVNVTAKTTKKYVIRGCLGRAKRGLDRFQPNIPRARVIKAAFEGAREISVRASYRIETSYENI